MLNLIYPNENWQGLGYKNFYLQLIGYVYEESIVQLVAMFP